MGTKLVVVSQVESAVRGPQRDLGPGYIRPNPVESCSSWNTILGLTSEPVTKMANRGGGEENINADRNNDKNNSGDNARDNDRINTLLNGNNDWRDGTRRGPEENEEDLETTFGFPFLDITRNITMKNTPLESLPLFHGMSSEYFDSFMFEFDILCRSYNYYGDAHKLKIFPATSKDSTLRWFMTLGEHTINSWDDMKFSFLNKYQDYFKRRDVNDIFRMQQIEEESLEEYLQRFLYNYHKSRVGNPDERIFRTISLKGLREECIETLNLLSFSDIYKNHFTEIIELCRTYSRSQAKVSKRF